MSKSSSQVASKGASQLKPIVHSEQEISIFPKLTQSL